MTGLYIHVPFCAKKCDYCDFYSISDSYCLMPAHIEAILVEAKQHKDYKISTLYLGGGTPSLLGPKNLEKLVTGLKQNFDLSKLSEATIEGNPDSATKEFLEATKNLGINRVSIGIQSLDDSELRSVGRIHNRKQALDSLRLATSIFERVSADLIIGLPGQTWESLSESVGGLLGLGLKHLSLYCLAIENGTKLERHKPNNLPSDDEQAELFDNARALLEQNGLVHYEISNFAKPGQESIHNLNYWRGREYIGLGPNASSHLHGERYKNKPDLASYIADPMGQKDEFETLAPKEKAAEEAMLRLRLLEEGLNFGELEGKFGDEATKGLLERLKTLTAQKLLSFDGRVYCIPKHLVLTSNPIFAKVLGF